MCLNIKTKTHGKHFVHISFKEAARILIQKSGRYMNNLKLGTKLRILYIFCVLIPLIVTDSVVLYIVVNNENTKQKHAMENEASAIQYSLTNSIDYASAAAKQIYMNEYIENYLNYQYADALEYVVAYQEFMKTTLFQSGAGMDNTIITIYADNPTIVNGGEFWQMSSIENTGWYQTFAKSGLNTMLYFYYDDEKSPVVDAKRKILFIKKLDFFGGDRCDKLLKIELDYSNMVRDLVKLSYDFPVYICQDEMILLANDGHSSVNQNFEQFTGKHRIGMRRFMSLYGSDLQIYILEPETGVLRMIWENMPFLILLILTNAILPWKLMKEINRSLTVRIERLSQVFDSVEDEYLNEIDEVSGNDEIGRLMENYNRMAARTNDLIQTVYKDRIREQEMNIARQKAELLALHSQINPHFLFNALESIRMHCILKKELETAQMVEKLAIMERQNVDWATDTVEIKKEMEFVEAYLGLQKYRFGERLSYELEVEEDCENINIPKLTVVTFVENACIHGIESKTAQGWIFVRIYIDKTDLCIEVEDTGNGIEEEGVQQLLEIMQNASIERLKEKGRVGVVNACLRLKMVTQNRVKFALESEKGIGTIVQIRMPLEKEKE
ncbi:MAG: histidine kinase [Lachnospiraceae bacterium]|nr:histidine kinase [Lachnospiraceae bacterium]